MTRITVTYDQAEHCLILYMYSYEPGLIARLLGVVLEAMMRERLRCK